MISYGKKPYEPIGQRIIEYKKILSFYKNNCESRFQTKNDLRRILNEIEAELDKKQTKEQFDKLHSIYNRLGKFI